VELLDRAEAAVGVLETFHILEEQPERATLFFLLVAAVAEEQEIEILEMLVLVVYQEHPQVLAEVQVEVEIPPRETMEILLEEVVLAAV
jgi:hypothetical protein